MEIFIQVLLALMVLVFIAELAVDFANAKYKIITAVSICTFSGGIIHFLGITKLDSVFSSFVLAGFLFSGSYLVFRSVTWLRS